MEDTIQHHMTDDEIEMDEDLEAMLYSQIHYAYDYELQADCDQNSDRLQAAAPSPSPSYTKQHVFSVKSLASEEHSTSTSAISSNHLQDSEKHVSDGFGGTGDVVNVSSSSDDSVVEISFSSETSRRKKSSEMKSSGCKSDVHTRSSLSSVTCDPGKEPDVLPQTQHKRDNMSEAAETTVTNSTRKDMSHQTYLPDVICLDKSMPFSKNSKPNSKSKFDLEAELGIPKQPVNKQQVTYVSDTDSEIDTITIKPRAKKPRKAESFLKFDGHETDVLVNTKTMPGNDYKKPLRRILASHSVAKKTKLNLAETVVIHSDGASSSSSEDDNDSTSSSTSESDSDNSPSEPKKKNPKLSSNLDLNWNVNSTDCQTIKIIENQRTQVDESKWRIDKADMRGAQTSRYYSKKEINCNNCNKQGHLSKRCPEPKKKPNCGLCGESGHMMTRCVNRLCFNCNLPGHTGARCPAPRRDRFAKCPRCWMKGHSEDQCPDLWRQFHSTITTAEDLVSEKEYMNSRVWCSNCARRGHFVHECRYPLMEKMVFPTYPFIVKYDMASPRQRNKNISGSKSETPNRGSYTKFTSDSEPDNSKYCGKLESSQSPDAHTQKRSSKQHSYAGDHQNVSTPHGSRSADRVQNQSLFPRGRLDKSSHNTWPRQQRYYQQSEKSNKSWKNSQDFHGYQGHLEGSREFSTPKRQAQWGSEDLSHTSKKPRIDSEMSGQDQTKKKAKPNKLKRQKLRHRLGKANENPTPHKKERRKHHLDIDQMNQKLTPAKSETLSKRQRKKLQFDCLSQNADGSGSPQKRKGSSPKQTKSKRGKRKESTPQAESRSPKQIKNKSGPLSKSPHTGEKKTFWKKKQNNEDGRKHSSTEVFEGRKQSKRAQNAGLISQCRSKFITTMSGFRSAFLASNSIK